MDAKRLKEIDRLSRTTLPMSGPIQRAPELYRATVQALREVWSAGNRQLIVRLQYIRDECQQSIESLSHSEPDDTGDKDVQIAAPGETE